VQDVARMAAYDRPGKQYSIPSVDGALFFIGPLILTTLPAAPWHRAASRPHRQQRLSWTGRSP